MNPTLGVAGPPLRTRRGLLTTVSGAIGVLLAGCVRDDTSNEMRGDDSSGTENSVDDGQDSTPGEGGSTDEGDDSRGEPSHAGDGNAPTSAPPGEPPAGCPDYAVARTVCDNIGNADADTFLEPDRQSVPPDAEIAFTLWNGSERVLETNVYNWALHRYVDGGWYYVAPRESPDPLMHLPPGDTHTWTLSVDNDAALSGEQVPGVTGTEGLALDALGGGYYAFRARGWFENGNYKNDVAFAATFELDAEPIPLVPTDAVESVTVEDDTLVAETGRGDPDEHERAAYVLERVDGDAAESLIVEQVYRDDQLRDVLALAYEHGVDRVRLEGHTGSVPPFAMSYEGRFAFQGETFEVTAERLE